MWLVLLLPILALSRSIEDTFSFLKLRYSILIVDDNEEEWEQYKAYIDNVTTNYEYLCRSKSDIIPEDACKEVIQALDGTYFSNSDNVEKILHKIPQNAEVLYLFNAVNGLYVNFNKLVDQKKVVIFDFNKLIDDDLRKTKKISTKNKDLLVPSIFSTFLAKPKSKSKSSTNDQNKHLYIYGNIKYRVSYLVIALHDVHFEPFGLNIDTLILYDSTINSDSNSITTSSLIVSPESHFHIIKQIKDKDLIKVHQYGVFFDDIDLPLDDLNNTSEFNDVVNIDYRIVFQSDRWELLYKEHGKEDEDYKFDEVNYIPYTFCDVANIIVRAFNFDLNVTDESVKSAKDVNLTIMNLYDYVTPVTVVLLEEHELSITTSGRFSELETKPKIIVHKDNETVLKTDVEVDVHDLYSYIPKQPVPTPTVDPSPHFTFSKVSAIFVFDDYESCKSMKSEYEEMFYSCPSKCVEGSYDYAQCMAKCESFGELMCSNGKDFNEKLKYISEDTDFLFVVNTIDTLNPDFNNLNQKMFVYLYNELLDDLKDIKKGAKKVMKIFENPLSYHMTHSKKSKDDITYSNVYINGGIKEKVSFLVTIKANLTITDEDLSINSVYFFETFFNPESKRITATNFITDFHSYELNEHYKDGRIKVDQFGISIQDEDMSNDPSDLDFNQMEIRVVFGKDSWSVTGKEIGDPDFSDDDGEAPFTVPYEMAKKLNIITKSLYLDLHVNNTDTKTIKPLNFTVLNFSPFQAISSFILEDISFTVTTSGLFDDITRDEDALLVSLPDTISISAAETLKVKRESLYSYEPKVRTHKNPFTEPVFTTLCVSNYESNCTEERDDFYDLKENYTTLCRQEDYYSAFEGGYSQCCAYYQSYGEFIISNVEEFDQKLSQIPKETDTILIQNYVEGLRIDLNKLESQMSVNINSVNDEDLTNISINGDIKEKVSYLTVFNSKLNIVDHDIEINTLALIGCIIRDTEFKIRSSEFLVDPSSHADIIKNIDRIILDNVISVSQYGYVLWSDEFERRLKKVRSTFDDNDFVNKDFRISLTNDRWLLLAKEHGKDEEYKPYADDEIAFDHIPYQVTNSFNLIVKAFDFDFNVENAEIKKIKPVNITIDSFRASFMQKSKLFKPRNVTVTSSGNWEGIENKPTMILTSYGNEVNVEPFASKDVDIKQEELYEYVPKSIQPDDGGDGSSSTETEITVTTETITTSDSGSDDDGSGGKDKGKNKVAIIVGVVIGVVALAVIIGVLVWYFKVKKSKNENNTTESLAKMNLLLEK